VSSFPNWHYEFDLQGVKTPIFDKRHRIRHQQRISYFFDPLVELCGGSLKGKRVLDLGCNAGFWSLQAIKAGADYVHGVDGRQMHIDQANLVFEALAVEPSRYQFSLADVTNEDFTKLGSFDVVLCLGLLYHISKPIEMFENVAKVSSDLLLIDTTISPMSGSLIELHRERVDQPRNAIDYSLVMIPTRRAVLDMVTQFGYEAVPLELNMDDYEGSGDYLQGNRLAFAAAKLTDLSRLHSVNPEPSFVKLERLERSVLGNVRAVASASVLLARDGVQHRGKTFRVLGNRLTTRRASSTAD
jgi:2-polyprenyl-3-methyl-5-hydroxy-6-metoxy-1,4-benzoquinol methylase